jgi:hypothetical protein
MTLDILRRTGGWCVELQQPLKSHTGEITAIEIRPPTAEIVIRWGNYEIESMLALLSRLCDLPERVLRQLPTADFDRVMFAFMNTVGSSIKADIEEGKRPLATPDELMPEPEKMVPAVDQRDPRFPDPGSGPVVRLAEKKPADVPPMNLNPPPVSEAVR